MYYVGLCAENVDAKLNGFDRISQHSWQTTETAQIHMPPSSLSNGPVDSAVNNVAPTDHTDLSNDVTVHTNPARDNGHITVNNPESRQDHDYNDDTSFPSPPTSVLSNGRAKFALAEQHGHADNSVNIAHSIPEPVHTKPSVYDYDDDIGFPSLPDIARSSGLAVSAATEQCDDADDCVTTVHSVSKPDSVVPVTESYEQPAPTAPDVAPAVSSPCPPAPPPPPPPLPTSFNARIPPSSSATSESERQLGNAGHRLPAAGLPSLTQQQQLEEARRRDASHAALLAAVARRRNLLETTDTEQVAKAIESQIQRNSKIQTVFRAGAGVPRQRSQSLAPTMGLLAPVREQDVQKAVESGEYLLYHPVNCKNANRMSLARKSMC